MTALVIVESAGKVKKIQSILDKLYGSGSHLVMASLGHLRDLPKDKLGIDLEHDFEPHYVLIDKKRDILIRLRVAVKTADKLYLATDPDREGEAIAWHLLQLLQPKCPSFRIRFNAIDAANLKAAFNTSQSLDMALVRAQESRRLLDRLVGYKLSPALQKQLGNKHLSAGRVQTAALRLLVERQRAIEAFSPIEYWSLEAQFRVKAGSFQAKLVQWQGQNWDEKLCSRSELVQGIVQALKGQSFRIKRLESHERLRPPLAPFTTSSLQMAASSHLRLGAERTMDLARQLYEAGLISYIRTDSKHVSTEAHLMACDFIQATWGEFYLPAKAWNFKAQANAQEAHEAIRPLDIELQQLPADFADEQVQKLYSLIWRRFLASEMAAACYQETGIRLESTGAEFLSRGSVLLFEGFLAVYDYGSDLKEEEAEEKLEAQVPLPAVTEDENAVLEKLIPQQHLSRPPSFYSEASLVAALESSGIGRPSTYAQILLGLKERLYAQQQKRRLLPTDLGLAVHDFLVQHFGLILDLRFTATMELALDKIASQELDARKFLKTFWETLEPLLRPCQEAEATAKASAENCPKCQQGQLILKQSQKGSFFGCSRYPDCNYSRDAAVTELSTEVCPSCASVLVLKQSRKGEKFWGCSSFPNCRFTKSSEKTLEEGASS